MVYQSNQNGQINSSRMKMKRNDVATRQALSQKQKNLACKDRPRRKT